jgi:hypothetical protein
VVGPEQMSRYRADPRVEAWLSKLGLPDYWRVAGWPEVRRSLGDNNFQCE